MIEFVWPLTTGEWLAWSSAFVMVLYGTWMVFAPGRWLVHFQSCGEFRRSAGGGYIGFGIAVLTLHPQPLLYLALGSSLLFMAIGRMVSIGLKLSRGGVNGGTAITGWFLLVITGILAFFSLSYALGLIR